MKRIYYIILLFLSVMAGASAQNANDIVDKAAAVYTNSNGITATFTIRTHTPQYNSTESFEGTINMKGDKFTLVTPDILTWYDGTTQWTYMLRSEEVNVSTPDGDELQFTNPSILLNTYKKGFTAVYKGESTAPNGKAAYDVELAPKKKSDIEKVELQIEKHSGLPASITVRSKNGMSSTVRISNVKTGINQPDNFFTFDGSKYPEAEVIDLR